MYVSNAMEAVAKSKYRLKVKLGRTAALAFVLVPR
jgi:hypothetical protein